MKTTLRSFAILSIIGWLVLTCCVAQAQVDFTSSYSFTGGNNGSGGVNTSVPSIAHGLHGRSYAVVQFRDSIRIGSVVRRVMTVPGSHALLVCFDSLKQVAWTRLISPLSSNGTVVTMDTDGLGNVWLAGLCGDYSISTSIPITFEGQPSAAAPPLVTNTWVASYSATGVFRWATVMPSTFNSTPPWLATTAAGNAYVAYRRSRTISSGSSADACDVTLFKFSPSGQLLYSRQDAVVPSSVSVTGSGVGFGIGGFICDPVTERLYMSGNYNVPITIGSVPFGAPVLADVALLCYDATLTPLWAQRFPVQPSAVGTTSGQIPAAIFQMKAGPRNSLFARVGYDNSITIGTTTFVNPSPSPTAYSPMMSQLVRFSATGQLSWHIPSPASGLTVYYSNHNSFYIASESNQPFSFGNYLFLPAPPATPGGTPNYNAFVATLDTTGAPGWLRQTNFDSLTRATPLQMAVSANGDLLLTGRANRAFTWGSAQWQPMRLSTNNPYPWDTYMLYSGPAPLTRLQFLPQAGAPGTTVVLNGHNLQSTSMVRFNGLAATFRVNASGDQIVATVPAGTRSGPITITTPQATQTTASNFRVTTTLAATTAIAAGFALYPNPAQDILQVIPPQGTFITSLSLYDGLGRQIRTWSGNPAATRLDLKGLTPGVYVLKALGNNTLANQRVIIK